MLRPELTPETAYNLARAQLGGGFPISPELMPFLRFYVIEYEYVGHDHPQEHREQHTYNIQIEPGTTNKGHRPLVTGWLGTTNDVSAHAHGEFESIEEARTAIKVLAGGLWPVDWDPYEDVTVLETYFGEEPVAFWEAYDWLSGSQPSDVVLPGESVLEAAARIVKEAYATKIDGRSVVIVGGQDAVLDWIVSEQGQN